MVCNGGRGQRLMHCNYAVELTSVAMVLKVAWFMGEKGGGGGPCTVLNIYVWFCAVMLHIATVAEVVWFTRDIRV